MAEHDADDDYNVSDLETLTKAPVTAAECLAEQLLAKALTKKAHNLIKRGSSVLVIQLPDADWAEPISNAISKQAKTATRIATEKATSNKQAVTVGSESLRLLQRGKTIAFISQDPATILDPAVLAAADITVTVPPITVNLLRAVIRAVSGGIARGVTAEMAQLRLDAIVTAVRPGLSPRACVANLQRSILPAPAIEASPLVPLLTELPLNADMRRWADETLADLSAVAAGKLDARALVYGVLEGAPGTGKTLLARSLARTSGWNFVTSSVGNWFTTKDGALGGVARNLKTFIDEALATEPAIAFLDELDGLPDRARLDDRSRDWWVPVVNLALTEIDRLRASGKRILLLGGTNYHGRLDAALVRPGRLQKRISVLPPQTREELAAVFRFYLGPDLANLDLTALAQLGLGATPAMVEGWIQEARGTARSAGRPLTDVDVLAQIIPADARRPADIKAIALHEAGHALVASRLGHEVEMISIVPNGRVGGIVRSKLLTTIMTLANLRDVVTVMLAGRAADLLFSGGANTGAESDLENATRLLVAAYEQQGLGETLVYAPVTTGRPSAKTVAAVSEELHHLLQRAIGMLKTESDLAIKLAKRLVEAKVLTGAEVSSLLQVQQHDRSGKCPKKATGERHSLAAGR